MSWIERIIQAVLFEAGAVLLGLVIMKFIPHEGEGEPLLVMVLISLVAMLWNFIFNWVFDKFVPGDRLARGPLIRSIHAVLFEGLLLAATVPMIMYFMNMSFMMALTADISITLAILVYTYVYNWVYDHVRVYFVKD